MHPVKSTLRQTPKSYLDSDLLGIRLAADWYKNDDINRSSMDVRWAATHRTTANRGFIKGD